MPIQTLYAIPLLTTQKKHNDTNPFSLKSSLKALLIPQSTSLLSLSAPWIRVRPQREQTIA